MHDADIRGDERNSPAVNAHDQQDIGQRKAHGTTSVTPITDATDQTIIAGINSGILRVVKSGTYVLTRPANTSQYYESISHGLGFIPIIVFNVEQTTIQPGSWYFGSQLTRLFLTGANSGKISEIPIVTVDETDLFFTINAPDVSSDYGESHTFTFKYYLLQQTSNNPDST